MSTGKKTEPKKITSFFFKRQSSNIIEDENQEAKRSKASTDEEQVNHPNQPDEEQVNHPNQPGEEQVNPTERFDNVEVNSDFLERDPGKRQPIWKYPVNQKELVRRRYLKEGPFQVRLNEYPFKGKDKRRFQYSWFNMFKKWLEYSPTTDSSAYCFNCYLYSDKPNVRNGTDAFTVKGFNNWKKVNDGKNYSFLKHIGGAQHKEALLFCQNFLNTEAHIENLIVKKNEEETLKNRIWWFTSKRKLQNCLIQSL